MRVKAKLKRSPNAGSGRKAPILSKANRARNAGKSSVRNALAQKALVYAAQRFEPPAISDEVPEQMPFVTDGQ